MQFICDNNIPFIIYRAVKHWCLFPHCHMIFRSSRLLMIKVVWMWADVSPPPLHTHLSGKYVKNHEVTVGPAVCLEHSAGCPPGGHRKCQTFQTGRKRHLNNKTDIGANSSHSQWTGALKHSLYFLFL